MNKSSTFLPIRFVDIEALIGIVHDQKCSEFQKSDDHLLYFMIVRFEFCKSQQLSQLATAYSSALIRNAEKVFSIMKIAAKQKRVSGFYNHRSW